MQKIQAKLIRGFTPVEKSATPNQLDPSIAKTADVWLTPRHDMRGLSLMKQHSSILPQCIQAYKNNIAGFGLSVRYKNDVDETPEMAAEFTKAENILNSLSPDMDVKEVFENVIGARETYGVAYIEVIRNLSGEVAGVEFVRDTPNMQKTLALPSDVEKDGRLLKFRKYRQQVGGKTIFFKEIGDPRIMDWSTGEYVTELPLEQQANEIIEFTIGVEPYGEVRWIGQTLGIDGSRRAEQLNNRYFSEGRHTPLMICIKNGNLTDESRQTMQDYINGIKGAEGQHAFLVLEAANMDSRNEMEDVIQPDINIVKLGDVLQKDELFQDYLDNNRRRVQSAFRLPDIYVGYSMDFNRATAQTAREITEEQVFQPERLSLAWIINNKLLAEYNFQHVEVYFEAPKVTNPDDIMKILSVTERAGGLTPNKAREIALNLFGETSENYEGEWANIPLAYAKSIPAVERMETVDLLKSAGNNEIAAVLKEVKKMLRQLTVDSV